ncbi:MAG: hypothetical protein EXR88_04405 [Gammaproteobacteria bacterium]|nr:hypothetical protein [Gammaproteobacteria bacterium]
MNKDIVIVGAGQAAAQTADALRRRGYIGRITLVGDEPYLPYQRPPLSKKYLANELEISRLFLRQQTHYEQHQIKLCLNQRATSINRRAQSLQLTDGQTLHYDSLVLATGARARKINANGSGLRGIFYLRSLLDADTLRAELAPGKHAVIIGGGYIGLEIAATLRHLHIEVTILEMAGCLLSRVVAEPVSNFYKTEHARHGVSIKFRAQLAEYISDSSDRVCAVRTTNGDEYKADLVIVGIGAVPNDELAHDAGLVCENGIIVDEYCRTSDPNIYSIGDCSNHLSLHYGLRVRLESVDSAFEQANTLANNLLGTPLAHDCIPWFWSDQYHHKLLIVGLAQAADQIVLRGEPATTTFSCCHLRQGELVAIDTVNQAKDHMAARKLIAARIRPNLVKLADPRISLKDCAQ